MSNRETTKTALVTGASSGIGRAFARQLAHKGYGVTMVARREERLREIMESLPTGTHRIVVADLSTPAGVRAVGEEISAAPPNLLINNAGVTSSGAFHELDLAGQQGMMRLNVDATVALSHAFLGTAQAGDALINVSSVLGIMPLPNSAIYSASKAFVLSFSEALWAEQQARGVYVMALCPGQTATEIFTAAGGETPPASQTQTPQEVVREALLALRRRKSPTIVTGRKNRAFVLAARAMSRKSLVNLMNRLDIE